MDHTGLTALHRAAMWNQLEAVQFLVQHGADHRVNEQRPRSAEELARHYAHAEVAAYLAHVGL